MNRQTAAADNFSAYQPGLYRSRMKRHLPAAALLLSALFLAGCGNAGGNAPPPQVNTSVQGGTGGDVMSPAAQTSADITPADVCATRLHDISGPLLLYFSMHERLPARLEELRGLPGAGEDLTTACPVSGRQYVYAPHGLPVPNLRGLVVLYDPVPTHSGHHWAISLVPPVEGQPLQAKVVAVRPGHLPGR